MSIMVGVGRGASLGVLVKNAETLERLEKVDTLVVDKTGTLTEGKPVVTQVITAGDWAPDEVLRLAAGVEIRSEHPLGHAVVTEARARGQQVIVVSSGAIALGAATLGLDKGGRGSLAATSR